MAIEPIKGFYVHDEATDTDGVAKYDYFSVENAPRVIQSGRGYVGNATLNGNFLMFDGKTSSLSLDTVAIGGVTYSQLFGQNLVFENDSFSPAVVNAGNPLIEDEYTIKCLGSTSQQLYWEFDNTPNGWSYMACKVKVDRYTSGWAGIIAGGVNARVTAVTDGYVICSALLNHGTAAKTTAFLGTGSLDGAPGNLDAYVSDVVIANITNLFDDIGSNMGTVSTTMKSLYEQYLEIVHSEPLRFSIPVNSEHSKSIYVGAVLDATSTENRFLAMKQLFDTAKRLEAGERLTGNELTLADKGAVCRLPTEPMALYEGYDFDWIFSQNGDTQSFPCSTTKVLAVITALDYLSTIKNKITIESVDVQSGSGNYFDAGDVLTYEDIIYSMMLPSSNTCAMALAHNIGKIILGDDTKTFEECVSAFTDAMNEKADKIGVTNSTFTSPSGYNHTDNKTTVKDLIRICIDACAYPELLRIWGKKEYVVKVGGTNARNVNLQTTVANETLESDYYIFGGKTGSLYYSSDENYNALVMVAQIKS